LFQPGETWLELESGRLGLESYASDEVENVKGSRITTGESGSVHNGVFSFFQWLRVFEVVGALCEVVEEEGSESHAIEHQRSQISSRVGHNLTQDSIKLCSVAGGWLCSSPSPEPSCCEGRKSDDGDNERNWKSEVSDQAVHANPCELPVTEQAQ